MEVLKIQLLLLVVMKYFLIIVEPYKTLNYKQILFQTFGASVKCKWAEISQVEDSENRRREKEGLQAFLFFCGHFYSFHFRSLSCSN